MYVEQERLKECNVFYQTRNFKLLFMNEAAGIRIKRFKANGIIIFVIYRISISDFAVDLSNSFAGVLLLI